MNKKRPRLELSNEQQLVLGLLLVILLAVSLLYCLGFASLALRRAWEETDLPWTTPETGEEILDVTPEIVPPFTPNPSPTPSSRLRPRLESWTAEDSPMSSEPTLHDAPVRQLISLDRKMYHSYNLHAAAGL